MKNTASPCRPQSPSRDGRLSTTTARRLLAIGGLLAASLSIQAADTGVWVYARDAVPISIQTYGVNNYWDQVTSARFPAFDNKLNELGYSLLRFPGGFESEYYDWNNNTTPGYPRAPLIPGATPAQVISAAPSASFVVRTREYMRNPTTANRTLVGDAAVSAVNTYKDQVNIWEIGNEWWLFGGDRATLKQRYIDIAKHVATRIKEVHPTSTVYITGDWTQPTEFTSIKNGFGTAAWANVDGISLHVYAGDVDADNHIDNIQPRIAQIKSITGKNKIYVSEWAPSKAYTGNKSNLQAANVMFQNMWHMQRAGVDAAAYWPPSPAGIPGLNLMNFNFTQIFPTGTAFSWMSTDMIGASLSTTYQEIPAVSSRDGNRLVVFLLGYDKGSYDVTVNLVGYSVRRIIESKVMYSSDPTLNTTPSVADAGAIRLNASGSKVKVTINKGGANRGTSYEIIRLVLDGIVWP